MDANITIQIREFENYMQGMLCYEETIQIPITLNTSNYGEDAFIIFQSQIINTLTKAMIKYKDMNTFRIKLIVDFDTINHKKTNFHIYRTIRTNNQKSMKSDIQHLKYDCEYIYRQLSINMDSTLTDLQNDLLKIPSDYITWLSTHANKTIDQIRRY